MSTVTVSFSTAVEQYPTGTTSTGVSVALVGPVGVPAQVITGDVAVFSDVPDGLGYTATAQLLDEHGAVLGALITSSPFDVVTPKVGIATPSAISIVVSA